jgi:hypothetical protein
MAIGNGRGAHRYFRLYLCDKSDWVLLWAGAACLNIDLALNLPSFLMARGVAVICGQWYGQCPRAVCTKDGRNDLPGGKCIRQLLGCMLSLGVGGIATGFSRPLCVKAVAMVN